MLFVRMLFLEKLSKIKYYLSKKERKKYQRISSPMNL